MSFNPRFFIMVLFFLIRCVKSSCLASGERWPIMLQSCDAQRFVSSNVSSRRVALHIAPQVTRHQTIQEAARELRRLQEAPRGF